MRTKLFTRRSYILLTLTAVCGLALSIAGCGSKSEDSHKAEDQTTQQMRKNKKDD